MCVRDLEPYMVRENNNFHLNDIVARKYPGVRVINFPTH